MTERRRRRRRILLLNSEVAVASHLHETSSLRVLCEDRPGL